ncbi:MAG: hypothetical protein ACK4M9_22630 [Anaerobacillus sp.]|uniref:hypothetical protein n=1 Tax=Anaerobacillus sp. TaxID=1872506 RepID=UPI00391BCE9F
MKWLTFEVITMAQINIDKNNIYYLEKKAGISNKLIWIRAVILIIILVSIYFSLYN